MSRKLFALGVAFAATVAFALPAQGQTSGRVVTVSVLTGRDGVSGFIDNVAPSDARYSGVGAVATVGSDTYIVDTNNNRIRRIITTADSYTVGTSNPVPSTQPGSQIVQTIVGTGVAGSGGDGGHPLQAQLNRPGGICVSNYSHTTVMYVADTGNNKIRRIEFPKVASSYTVTPTTGGVTANITPIITTVAGTGVAGYSDGGTSALQAMLNGPMDIQCGNASSNFLGTSGQSLTFADTNNHVIRTLTVNAAGVPGAIGVKVGTPGVRGFSGDGGPAKSARLNFPMGIASCADGPFMIADTGNNRIRVLAGDVAARATFKPNKTDVPNVELFPGIESISTFAGSGTPGNRGDGGDPLDAQLNGPTDLVCSYSSYTSSANAGDVASILDTGNDRIRRVESVQSYVISTSPSFGAVNVSTMGSIVGAPGTPLALKNTRLMSGSNSDMLIADAGGHVVRRVTVS